MKNCIKKNACVIAVAVLVFGISGCKPEVKAHVHTQGADAVTVCPTCAKSGSRTYTCTGCGKVITENFPALGLCEKPIDAETYKAATSSSKYIYFGVFPKNVAYKDNSGNLYAADKTTVITIDETDIVTMGSSTYYKGSDGEYYAKVTENACSLSSSDKTYKDGTTVQLLSANSTRYFMVEPIKWKVITTKYDIDRAKGTKTGSLLLAEDILTANIPYFNYNSSSNTRTIDGVSGIYPNNYKYSQIRAYLNGLDYYYDTSSTETTKVSTYNAKGFLQTAFTESARTLINTTTVDNRKETTGPTSSTYATAYACEDTEEKIFLLSESEVLKSSYGFKSWYEEDSSKYRYPTDYARANFAFNSDGGSWWLRSPYYNGNYDACSVNKGYDYCYAALAPQVGVVPALTISF